MRIVRPAIALGAIAALAGCANAALSGSMLATIPSQNSAHIRDDAGAKAARGKVLYIADIDGQPGVGQVHVYTADMNNPQFLRTITSGTGRPFGLWVDSKNILYVANEANKYPASVTEFQPGASSPFFQITNFKGTPKSVAVDANQNVFVNEAYEREGWVQEFAPGSNTPEQTIDTGIGGYAFDAGSMAFDPQGNLVVAEQAALQLSLVRIARGSFEISPIDLDFHGKTINGPGIGIDHAGNIYVASLESGTVSVFPPGQTEPSRTISPVAGYGLTWVTPAGAVYQASGGDSVAEIAPGGGSPVNSLACACSLQGAAVSR